MGEVGEAMPLPFNNAAASMAGAHHGPYCPPGMP